MVLTRSGRAPILAAEQKKLQEQQKKLQEQQKKLQEEHLAEISRQAHTTSLAVDYLINVTTTLYRLHDVTFDMRVHYLNLTRGYGADSSIPAAVRRFCNVERLAGRKSDIDFTENTRMGLEWLVQVRDELRDEVEPGSEESDDENCILDIDGARMTFPEIEYLHDRVKVLAHVIGTLQATEAQTRNWHP